MRERTCAESHMKSSVAKHYGCKREALGSKVQTNAHVACEASVSRPNSRAVKTQRTHRIAVIDAKRLLRRLAVMRFEVFPV